MAKKKNAAPKPRTDAYIIDNIETLHNESLEYYYKTQCILPEDEWDDFMRSCKTVLPSSFRITNKPGAQELLEYLKTNYLADLSSIKFEGEAVKPPTQIPWFPSGLAWQLEQSKAQLRKVPDYRRLQGFLVHETNAGSITRQEAVSMIPPLILDVQPHHIVLDVCAAPGSKTSQLLEALHVGDASTPASGLVIANDADAKRAYMLIHQTARLPSLNLMVTNVDASLYPKIMCMQKPLMFDRILCDVPCSGDGTMRKNLMVWRDWTTTNGNGLHTLQLSILRRSLAMLKAGGRLVYSTCSMNPVENEAVVCAALKSFPDVELIDCSSMLPELKRRQGMTSWKVFPIKKENHFFSTRAEFADFVQKTDLSEKEKSDLLYKAPETLWSPDDEFAEKHALQRCMRLYPHLQNTGGFFVALLEKRGSASNTSAETQISPSEDTDAPASHDSSSDLKRDEAPVIKKRRMDTKSRDPNRWHEDPFSYLAPENEELQTAIEHFGLNASFDSRNCLVRNATGTPAAKIYYTSPLIRQLLVENNHDKLRLLSCGVKAFERSTIGKKALAQDVYQCRWRITSEGLATMMPALPSDLAWTADESDLRVFLKSYFPATREFADDSIVKSQIGNASVPLGSHVGKFTLPHIPRPFYMPIWKSNNSACLMIDKQAKSELSVRVFGSDITEAAQAKGKNSETATPVDLVNETKCADGDVDQVEEATIDTSKDA